MDAIPQTTPPAPATEPDLADTIHYALNAESFPWHAMGPRPTPLCGPVLGHLRMIAIPAGLLLLFAILESLPIPRAVSIGVYVIVTLVVLVPIIRRGMRERRENERLASRFAKMSDPARRLRVTGPAARLERLRSLLAVEAEEFEPRIIRVGRPRRTGVVDITIWTLLFSVFFAGFFFAKELARVSAPYLGHTMVFAALTLTFLVWSFLWPTYLRFVPGRLDILNYNILGRGHPTVRSFDLRTIPILVMIPGTAALFTTPDSTPSILDVGPTLDADPFAFERALLAAAKSSAPTPPLPDDELLG